MAGSGEKQGLHGLARSIDTLFSEHFEAEPKPGAVEADPSSDGDLSDPSGSAGAGSGVILEAVDPPSNALEVEAGGTASGEPTDSEEPAAFEDPAAPAGQEGAAVDGDVGLEPDPFVQLDPDGADVEGPLAGDAMVMDAEAKLEAGADEEEASEAEESSGSGEEELSVADVPEDAVATDVVEHATEAGVPGDPGRDVPSVDGRLDVGDVPGQDVVWEAVPEPVGGTSEELDEAIDDFLVSSGVERSSKVDRIDGVGRALKTGNKLDALTNGVLRLAREDGDPRAEVTLSAIRSIFYPAVASRLMAMLGMERDEERRSELIAVLCRVGPDMAGAVAEALGETNDRFARRVYLDVMVRMGEDARPIVEEMMADGRWFVVRNGIAVLSELGGEGSVEMITSTLAHKDARVRKEALLALAKVGGEDAGQLAYGMLEDPDADVRLAAATAAGALKVERALKPLLKMLDGESDSDVLIAVLRALGQLGDPGAVNTIEKHAVRGRFSKPKNDVRIAAYKALNHIGTPHARRLLNQAMDDKDAEVKRVVRETLGMG